MRWFSDQGRKASDSGAQSPGAIRTAVLGANPAFGRLVPYFLGMTLLEAGSVLLYSSNVLLLPPANLINLPVTHLFSTVANVVTGLCIALAAWRRTETAPLFRQRWPLYALGATGAGAALGVACASDGILPPESAAACMALTAISGTCLCVALMEGLLRWGVQPTPVAGSVAAPTLVTQAVRSALACYAAAMVGGSVLALLVGVLPGAVGRALTIMLPLLAVAAWRPRQSPVNQLVSADRPSERQGPPDGRALTRPALRELLGRVPWQFILVAGIVSFAFGAVNTFYLPANQNTTPISEWALTLIANTAAFLIASLVAFYSFRINLALVFYVAIPFVALASVLLVIPLDLPAVILVPTTSIGVVLIRLLVWLLLVGVVVRGRASAAFCFGLLISVQFTGTFLGQILAVASANNDLYLSFAVLICLLSADFRSV
ncbi:MAG: hypothetical protein LBE08_01480 [Bifidobacteriaceae bacterium]|jgi:hypothetical protein|nr:hypothetical protein [Bifidobacteriaceae bacterium]